MRFTFLVIPSVLIFQVAVAQTDTSSMRSPVTVTTPVSAASSTAVTPPLPGSSDASESAQIAIIDYKSVFETETVEEEVKMAAERFNLTEAQQDIWLVAATERRQSEKQSRDKLGQKTGSYERENIYRGLRTSATTFHETITGYLNPSQKQSLENDRLIMQEKQKRLARIPPPPPVDTVAPVDSVAIKQAMMDAEAEKKTKKGKKGK
jgi:1,2-phenylacetyl-CoA epoxidase PaaB subunit